MVDTLRKRISSIKTIDELVKIALFSEWSYDSDGLPPITYKIVVGDSGNISAGVREEIWPLGTEMARTTTAETLSIVSSSIEDDAGGSGVDAVFVEGLDGDFKLQSELVVLDGTTPVTSTNSYVHVHEMNVLNITTSGTTNAGNITATQSSSGGTLGYILAGDSISKHGQFLIPDGYNALMLGGEYSVYRTSGSGSRRAEIDLQVTPLYTGASQNIEYRTLRLGAASEAAANQIKFDIPLVLRGRLFIHPHATAEANNTKVSVEYSLLLIKDTIDLDSLI